MKPSYAIIGAVLIMCFLIGGIVPSNASARVSGETWTYSMFTDVGGLNASGTITFEFRERTNLLVDGTRYGVDVVQFTGSVAGSGSILLIPRSVNATLSGTQYTANDGMTIAKEDMFLFSNTTTGSGGFQVAGQSETETITTFSPPYLLKFNPSKVKPGDSWSEQLTVNTTTIVYANGSVQSRSSASDDIVISVDIASAEEIITTDAGTFHTLKITVSRAASDFSVYWWSSGAGNIVVQRTYAPDLLGNPHLVSGMTLMSFEKELVETFIIVLIGVAIVIVAIVVIVAVLTTRGRSGQPPAYRPPQQAGQTGQAPPPRPPG